MTASKKIERLEEIARQIRVDIVTMLHRAGSGHTGGSLSAADVITALYFHEMRLKPGGLQGRDRDRFILSKGHGAPAQYAALARIGYFPREELWTLRRLGSRLQGHPDCRATPGVEVSTGSLGQGLSMGAGMALAARLDQSPARIYVLLGDGEVQEGQIWEAVMAASHYRLENLCAIVDHNGLQIDGPVKEIMNVEPLLDKFIAFGWHAVKIDGHSFAQILDALRAARCRGGMPTAIIAETVKGKGVSIFEHQVKYHGVAPSDDELTTALMELTREGNHAPV